VTWQQPLDFLQIGAWPATLTGRFKTIVEVELLQQWDSHRLSNPAATLSGFLKGVEHAAAATSSMPVSNCGGDRSPWVRLDWVTPRYMAWSYVAAV
jgi:hypothetical protein